MLCKSIITCSMLEISLRINCNYCQCRITLFAASRPTIAISTVQEITIIGFFNKAVGYVN